jgi:hypothetical protein
VDAFGYNFQKSKNGEYHMKVTLSILLIIFLFLPGLRADEYIKETYHRDGYYMGGINNPPVDVVSEVWLGKDRAVAINKSRKIIFDVKNKKVTYVNLAAKSYVEGALPLDASAILDDQVKGILNTLEFKMEITETGKTEKIKNWHCKEYTLNQWMQRGEERFGESETVVWACEEADLNLKLYENLFNSLIRLISKDDSLIKELQKIKGFTITTKRINWQEGIQIKAHRQVVEISKKDPAEGTYKVPEGFSKKEKLSLADVQNLLNN